MRSMFIISTCWVNIPSNRENVFSVNNNKKQTHKSRENIFLPCCFIAQDTKSNFRIQRKRWPVPRQSLAMLRLLQQINDWAFCRQERKKKGIFKMRSWSWNRVGLFKKDGNQMWTRWQHSRQPQHNSLDATALGHWSNSLSTVCSHESLLMLKQTDLAPTFLISPIAMTLVGKL